MIPVLVGGPASRRPIDGLLDTGADETVFAETLAGKLGIDLAQAEERYVNLAGRATPLRCRYASVKLQISDGRETLQWSAVVGFVPVRLQYSLMGHAGFLQFFDAEFRGADYEVVIAPNASFSGAVSTCP